MFNFIKNLVKILTVFISATSLVLALEVNTATQTELDTLKGIGPIKAKAIIEERNKNGLFKDSQDLAKRVSGLGSKSVSKLQANGLTINGKSDINISTANTSKAAVHSSNNTNTNKENSLNYKTQSNNISKPIIISQDKKASTENLKIGIQNKVDQLNNKIHSSQTIVNK